MFRVFALIAVGVALWAAALVTASNGAAVATVIVYALGCCAVALAIDAMR